MTYHEPKKPRLKGGAEFVAQEEVFSDSVNVVEVWKSPRGYYIYYVTPELKLELASGPHKSETRTLKKAKRIAKALKTAKLFRIDEWQPQKLPNEDKCTTH